MPMERSEQFEENHVFDEANEAKQQIVIEGRMKMTVQLGTGSNTIFRDLRQSQVGNADNDQMSHMSIFKN